MNFKSYVIHQLTCPGCNNNNNNNNNNNINSYSTFIYISFQMRRLQASTNLTVESLRLSATTAHIHLYINPFSASQLSTTNFSLIYNTYKIWHLVMRKWELIKQSQLLKIKSQILSNLFNEKYGLRLGEFKNTTGTERVKNACSR